MGPLVAQDYATGGQIPLDQVLERARDGEIIVLPRAMQNLDFFQWLRDVTLDTVRAVSSDSQARQVEDQGFEHIHKILSPSQVLDLNKKLSSIPSTEYFRIVRRCIEDGLGYHGGYYINSEPIVRTMVPFDVSSREKTLSSLHPGRIRPLSPHHDYWYPHPVDVINIWTAIGPVSHGNGMIIYPEMWGRPVPHNGLHMARDQWVGRPMNFNLEPGDILLFSGEHLHSTELNTTEQTRYVLGTRIAMGQLKYETGPPWVPYYDAASLDGPLAAFHRLRPYLRKPYFSTRYLRFLIGRALRKSKLLPARKRAPKPVAMKPASQPEHAIPHDLADGEIRAIDDARIAVRVGDDISILSRYCVHQGADLAQGYLNDGLLYCPWHNLCFDPKTGKQPCESLGHLKRFAG